ncbi:hypothetical protein U1839_14830 [Sphingomonas sp. RT2P30]|uniref:hypothetical protein n=1 Tax=Parasphingomonas halimpatiens TaxID=3096162 RepID=UPI002FC85A5A
MTDISTILADKRARIAGMETALAVERAELRGMEMMADLVGKAPRAPVIVNVTRRRVLPESAPSETASKGRQPGSISMRWRAVLWRLDEMGGDFAPSDIVSVVRDLEGREMRAADARRQMEIYVSLGFIRVENGTYNLTDDFRSKFAASANAQNENAPPSDPFEDILGGADTALHAQDRRPQE